MQKNYRGFIIEIDEGVGSYGVSYSVHRMEGSYPLTQDEGLDSMEDARFYAEAFIDAYIENNY